MAKTTSSRDDMPGITVFSPIVKTGWNHLNTPDEYEGKKTFKSEAIFTPDQLDEWEAEVLEATGAAEDLVGETINVKEWIDSMVEETYQNALSETKSVKKKKLIHEHHPYSEYEDADGEETGDMVLISAVS